MLRLFLFILLGVASLRSARRPSASVASRLPFGLPNALATLARDLDAQLGLSTRLRRKGVFAIRGLIIRDTRNTPAQYSDHLQIFLT